MVSPLISVTLTVSPAFGRDMVGIEAVLGYDKTLTRAWDPVYFELVGRRFVLLSFVALLPSMRASLSESTIHEKSDSFLALSQPLCRRKQTRYSDLLVDDVFVRP